jgi:D-glycero-D-manno-heptose 1,7-bisphosphate phosphatase
MDRQAQRSRGADVKLVILDRDGTINEDRDDFVKSADEWVPLPGALEAIARLNHAGWRVALVTNQSGLGRGLFDMATLNAIHTKMNAALAQHGGRIDAVFFCPHAPDDQCSCRKPLPGLLLEAGRRFGVDLAGVPMVGDSLRDLQAGVAAGCQPHLVRTGKAEVLNDEDLSGLERAVPGTVVHADLAAFVEAWLQREWRERGDDDASLVTRFDSGPATLI